MNIIIRFLKKLFSREVPEVKAPEVKAPEVKAPEVKAQTTHWPITIIFPDISHYEKCNFDQFTGYDLLTKATEGLTFVDSTLVYNMEQCKKRGIRFGVYHFYRAGKNPKSQADFFIKTVGLENLKNFFYAPIVDFETSKYQTEKDLKNDLPNLKIFIERIIEVTGRTPIFYSYVSLLKYLELDNYYTKCPLWIAKYSSVAPSNTQILPWKNYWAWQYSDGDIANTNYPVSFKGIGNCDSNIMFTMIK